MTVIAATGATYGPFNNLFTLCGSAVAVATALIATWWPKTSWHPTGELIERLAVLVTAIIVLLLSIAPWPVLLGAIVVGLVGLVIFGLQYADRLSKVRYELKIPTSSSRIKSKFVVSGSTLTPQAQIGRDAGKTIDDLVAECGYDVDCVWTRESQAKNAGALARCYLPTVIGGTGALAAAALLFGKLIPAGGA